MLKWLRGNRTGASMSAALGALDDVFNPGASRARESLKADHERSIPTPSPGDRLLDTGKVTIVVRDEQEST